MASPGSYLNSLWCEIYGRLHKKKMQVSHRDLWWDNVQKRYSEERRSYHTLCHLQEMFLLWKTNYSKLKDPDSIGLGIFFHDLVYNPQECDNEEQSAEQFKTFALEMGFDDTITEKVVDMILLTKAHKTDAHTSASMYGSEDSHFLLDFDMAILGAPKDRYSQYTKQIRQEYSHIADSEYCERRAKVLEAFLEMPNIFATKIFRESSEEIARANIKDEIHMLREQQAKLSQYV